MTGRSSLLTSGFTPINSEQKPQHIDREQYLSGLRMVFRFALQEECHKRQAKNENDHGRAIRQLLVEHSRRGELVQKRAKEVTRGLWFPGERKGHSEEAPSEAVISILQQVEPYAQPQVVASDSEFLRDTMEGSLNKVLERACDHIRGLIETERRRLSGEKSYSEDAARKPPSKQVASVKMAASNFEVRETEKKILFEQILAKSQLKPKDKELAILFIYEGRDQKEAGDLLGMSQGQVSKRVTAIRGVLKKAFPSTGT